MPEAHTLGGHHESSASFIKELTQNRKSFLDPSAVGHDTRIPQNILKWKCYLLTCSKGAGSTGTRPNPAESLACQLRSPGAARPAGFWFSRAPPQASSGYALVAYLGCFKAAPALVKVFKDLAVQRGTNQ